MQQSSPDAVTKKAHNILNKYLDVGAQNINALMGQKRMQLRFKISLGNQMDLVNINSLRRGDNADVTPKASRGWKSKYMYLLK